MHAIDPGLVEKHSSVSNRSLPPHARSQAQLHLCRALQPCIVATYACNSADWAAGKGSEIGDFLTTHPLCQAISFTGGDTGMSICQKAGMVPIQMELGGKVSCRLLCQA